MGDLESTRRREDPRWIVMATGYASYGPRYSYLTGLASGFAKVAPTYYVDPSVGWYPAILKGEPTGVISEPEAGILVFRAMALRSNDTVRGRRLNMGRAGRRLRPLLEGPGFAWVHTRDHLDMVRELPDSVTACSIGDGGEAGEVDRHEMLERVDFVLTVSDTLFENCSAYFPEKTFYLPCGVDRRVYAPLRDSEQGGHPDRRPSVLYYGAVNDRIDFGLVLWLSRRFSGCDFTLAGPVSVSAKGWHLARCLERQNVSLVEDRSPQEYGRMVRDAAACMIPYEHSEFNAYAHPLKLYDYWTFQKPVVTTRIPAFSMYRDLLHMGETYEGVAEGIDLALSETREDPARPLRAAVAELHDTRNLAAATLDVVSGREVRPDFFRRRVDDLLRDGRRGPK